MQMEGRRQGLLTTSILKAKGRSGQDRQGNTDNT